MDNRIKMLYVDDESVNLQLFEINFSDHYKVLVADNGFSGLDVLDKNPDTLIVISDMKMPKMDGLEFIRKAKNKFPEKHFYLLSGFEITDEIAAALETGLILKYFRKPYSRNEIESAIEETIR